VERAGLRPGERVLDVCCGSGASALPAAEAVGPSGRVLAVDVAEPLLALGREKARQAGYAHLEFRHADLRDVAEPAGFDAVLCVFGIFFLPDMAAGLRMLWSRVRPGGRMLVTTWGPRLFEPANSAFWDAVQEERPDLVRAFNPWDTIVQPDSLEALFHQAEIDNVRVEAEPGTHPLGRPEDWWTITMGSGYRGTIEALGLEAAERVRSRTLSRIAAQGVAEIEASVLYARADKPR
jgi:SAM-dependent methyltransferase